MATVLEHPIFPDQKQFVGDDGDVEAWKAQGWLVSDDKDVVAPSGLTSAEEHLAEAEKPEEVPAKKKEETPAKKKEGE